MELACGLDDGSCARERQYQKLSAIGHLSRGEEEN